MKEFFGFTWAHSSYFFTLIGLVIFIGLFLGLTQLLLKRLDRLGLKSRGAELFKNFTRAKKWIKVGLFCLSLLILWLGLMRPQKEQEDETVKAFGRELIVALDISRSMLAKDMENDTVDRFTIAKKKIHSLIDRLGADRVSLLLFSGTAFVYCPLTSDHESFLTLLDDIDEKMIASGSTSIENAIKKSLDIFELVPERKSKVLVIFTDGEDFSPDLREIKKRVADQKLTIFTVGVGSFSGAPIPMYSYKGDLKGYLRDENGSVVITRLDEKVLEAVARESGGKYIASTSNLSDMRTLERHLDRFEREELGQHAIQAKKEFYHYFSMLAGLLLLIEWLI